MNNGGEKHYTFKSAKEIIKIVLDEDSGKGSYDPSRMISTTLQVTLIVNSKKKSIPIGKLLLQQRKGGAGTRVAFQVTLRFIMSENFLKWSQNIA